MIAKMTAKTADVLFGGAQVNDFDSDMYALRKLADQILTAVADTSAVEFAFNAAGATSVEPEMPQLEFTMPFPDWDAL